MIKRCTEHDRDAVMQYLYEDPSYNIFAIGDIEQFGFDTDFLQLYIEENDNKEILSAFLRYRENGVYICEKPRFNTDYVDIIKHYNLRYFSGKTNIVKGLIPYFPNYQSRAFYFCATDRHKLHVSKPQAVQVQKLKTIHDITRLYDLMVTIHEFGYEKTTKDEFIKSKVASLEMGSTYFIEEDDKIVASASVTAETIINGMVVGVATDKAHRFKGYATVLMEYLMYEYLEMKHKDLCLFYDNPQAGHIYLRLGFEPIGTWSTFERSGDNGTDSTT